MAVLRKDGLVWVFVMMLLTGAAHMQGQAGTGILRGKVADRAGAAIKDAGIAVHGPNEFERTVFSGADGRYAVTQLPPGTYTIQVSASGFETQSMIDVKVRSGGEVPLSFHLPLATVSEEVTVESEADKSLASQLSPVKSVLDAGSARTEITSEYVNEFTSPVTDFADITSAAPGVVTWDSNGVGMGQAKIYYRGFKDDDYTITWDGIPFEDTNDPSHHSWAFVPGPAIGFVDFDRSPGTAADMGPANYGGSIHFFSPKLPSQGYLRAADSFGSYNTNMYLVEYYSGLFGGSKPKANLWLEGHHMSSNGYQTWNHQYRTAGTAKFTYQFSDKTFLSMVGTSVIVDANTPNNDPYRFQIQDYGNNFLLQNNYYNADGTVNGLYYNFFRYHIPTTFEVLTFTRQWNNGWRIETKPYDYTYSNHQHFNNNQYSEGCTSNTNNCDYESSDNGALTAASISATSGVDKMNQYAKGGDITHVTYGSKFGVLSFGGWYEYAYTNRYQDESDPEANYLDGSTVKDLKFHESFITRTYQPYAEYEFIAIPKFTITAGLKDANYDQTLSQWASDKDVGPLGCPTSDTIPTATPIAGVPICTAVTTHEASYNNVLPSVEVNYRIRSDWSVYAQYGRASIIPFSTVFDVANAEVGQTPPPTIATTYQAGTVLKLNRLAMDADVYHIHFINQYSSFTPSSGPDEGLSFAYATPPSDSTGFEVEGNYVFGHGLSLFLNGTAGRAKYEAAAAQAATATAPATAASPTAWVAETPEYTFNISPTYQSGSWDVGFFNTLVGPRWEDDGAYHQAVPLGTFWVNNLFIQLGLTRLW